ncbi:MAG TPA: DEAD/DEAH box helicase [Gaiellales bacterium]|jgi:ATP-dependent RNA helicase DeaD/ATP-dependent RNA helicase RhlE|nr:DEAD/DEAH box helicase [Gaiellales bacterium]
MDEATFTGLGVSRPVADALEKRGITEPFAIQARVIPDGLSGRDVLAQSPTGSGKTLAFGVPLVERIDPSDRLPAALVLVPTRELAVQVAEELEAPAKARGLAVCAVYGGAPLRPQAKRAQEAAILVATPGRLWDLIERRMIDVGEVRILVLDEADRMLDMGFQPQVDRIVRRLPKSRQTLFFSATLHGEVGRLARTYTTDPGHYEAELQSSTSRADISHSFVSVTSATKLDTLVKLLQDEPGLALVFVRTKRGADRLATRLRGRGVDTAAMHGDLPQRTRERVLKRFEAGEVRTLIATDVAARGLDLEAIAHVINYDPPEDHTGYVHRVGRTGRAGRDGAGVTLVLPEEEADVSRVAARLGHEDRFRETGMRVAPPRLVYTSRRRTGRRGW